MSGKARPEAISPTAVQGAPGLWRVDLQRHDLSIEGREVIQSRVEFEPDSPPFKHFHPGEEIICVLQGSLEYTLEGQPPVVCTVGDALTVPYGVHHQARNVGDGVAVELATYVVEKGKPLLTKVE